MENPVKVILNVRIEPGLAKDLERAILTIRRSGVKGYSKQTAVESALKAWIPEVIMSNLK